MNAVHILNVISSIVPSLCVFAQTAPIMVDNVYLPYVDDERYLNATIDYPYGSSVYHFQLSLYVDSEIINIELDMNHSWINVDVIKTVIEKKIHEEIQIECEQELSYED